MIKIDLCGICVGEVVVPNKTAEVSVHRRAGTETKMVKGRRGNLNQCLVAIVSNLVFLLSFYGERIFRKSMIYVQKDVQCLVDS